MAEVPNQATAREAAAAAALEAAQMLLNESETSFDSVNISEVHEPNGEDEGSPKPPSSLLEAVSDGDMEAILSMLANGCHPDEREKDAYGDAALHSACASGREELVLMLLAAGAPNQFPPLCSLRGVPS